MDSGHAPVAGSPDRELHLVAILQTRHRHATQGRAVKEHIVGVAGPAKQKGIAMMGRQSCGQRHPTPTASSVRSLLATARRRRRADETKGALWEEVGHNLALPARQTNVVALDHPRHAATWGGDHQDGK